MIAAFRNSEEMRMGLLEGKTGNTVVNVVGDQIYYMPTTEAIKRWEVDLEEVALFESLGTCFGRPPQKYHYTLVETKEPKGRHV